MTFVCVQPERPIDNGAPVGPGEPTFQDRWDQYLRQQQIYAACNRCDGGRQMMISANNKLVDATEKEQLATDNLAALQRTLTEKGAERDEYETLTPELKVERDHLFDVWEPVRVHCEGQAATYLTLLRSKMVTCVPSFYRDSCERLCIEAKLRPEGCAVMEGNLPNDITGR